MSEKICTNHQVPNEIWKKVPIPDLAAGYLKGLAVTFCQKSKYTMVIMIHPKK